MDLDHEFESDDSFFDDPKLSKKTKTTEKKSLEDIFGFADERKADKSGHSSLENIQSTATKSKVRFDVDTAEEDSKRKAPDWLGGSEDVDFSKKSSSSLKSNPKSDFFDDVLTTPASRSDSKKSFDLLDDLLPQRGRKNEQAKTSSFDDILRESKAQKSGPESLENPRQKADKPAEKMTPEGFSTILEPSQGPRRSRRGSNTGVGDVLGLFGPSKTEEKRSTSKDVPDWLGGSSTSVNVSDTTISLHKAESKNLEDPSRNIPQKEFRAETSTSNNEAASDIPRKAQYLKVSSQGDESSINTFQANISNLQTQESFLLVSLQLKKYEENLSEIKSQQQEILRKQENQFDLFLNKYIEKQKSIEHEMLAQQERVNDHIRALSGSQSNKSSTTETSDKLEGESNTESVDKIIQSLKQRHEEEFFLMEESYKKQISLLEKSSAKVEERLSEEIENSTKLYQEKIDNLKREHSDELKHWTDRMKSIDQKHQEDLENIKENHGRMIREVKDEFLDQLERFKEQRSHETELFAHSADYSQLLTASVEKLQKNEQVLGNIQEKVVTDYGVLSIARERSIENKEKELTAMREALERSREQAEKDRSTLFALVRTLEQKISEQNHNAQEERWALQQAASTLAARSSAFDRETEFSRASIEREREQIKTLKEAMLAEQEKVALELTEAKLKLTSERSRLEVSAKLMNNYEVEKMKTEAETAIQVAKELTDKLNLERTFVQRQKMELQSFRNQLLEKERDLLEREETVEEMSRSIQHKTSENRRVIHETKHLENRYKDKLLELQAQATSLSNREKKLAEEKLLVSKERLGLYTSMKLQASQKKCMLCQAETEHKLGKTESLPVGYGEPNGTGTTDPDWIRLRMDAMEDERNSEVSKEDNSTNTSKLH
ncbi:putative leucine-rich repeat-containing protein DDB_G0290503 [Dendroctonus ponderosae]|nr:putative leucine-rich repeat-containing protein DDB_G0290503 [Dendroctonus ponderosae]XP_048525724.1 putative leucine-rich repeat-containing protein DDB_G0290503 [Dendroctonus ponderosae]KAH0998618.1 hypothetical protein HUJ05_005760 [Dendroctonus ponderosae]KAH1008755.1 hypothetical protein HUJ05_009283 [Dendroctonus ponderosae]